MLGKVPDCASIDAFSLHMDNENSSDEMGELLCSDLDMPLIPSCIIQGILELYLPYALNDYTEDDAEAKKYDWLCDMYENIITMISMIVLDFVMPQIHSKMHAQTDLEFAGNSNHTSITTKSMEQNYHSVTEADIQASLGNVFDICFGDVFGVTQERSKHSEALLELVAARVTERVNRRLDPIIQSSSSPQPTESVSSEPPDESGFVEASMLNHTTRILLCLFRDNDSVNPEDVGESEDQKNSSCETDKFNRSNCEMGSSGIPEDDGDSEDLYALSEHSSSDSEDSNREDCSSRSNCEMGSSGIPEDDGDSEDLYALSEHSSSDSEDSNREDCSSILSASGSSELSNRHAEELSVSSLKELPQIDDVQSNIYEEISFQSGSAKLPQAAMVSGDVAFEEAVANTSKEQPQKSSGRTVSFGTKLKRTFCRKSRKVAPSCEINTSLPHTEVVSLENGGTPPPQRRPAIIRMFSSIGRILRKPFTSCLCVGSQDD